MSDYENIGDEVENAIVYALEAMRDSKVWRGPLRIDGTVKEFAEDVLSFVRAADDMKEGRNVVSLGTYQAATEERDALREQVATIATLTAERDAAVKMEAIRTRTVAGLIDDVERLTKERRVLRRHVKALIKTTKAEADKNYDDALPGTWEAVEAAEKRLAATADYAKKADEVERGTICQCSEYARLNGHHETCPFGMPRI